MPLGLFLFIVAIVLGTVVAGSSYWAIRRAANSENGEEIAQVVEIKSKIEKHHKIITPVIRQIGNNKHGNHSAAPSN